MISFLPEYLKSDEIKINNTKVSYQMKNLTNTQIVALICGLRQLQNHGYPYEVDEKLTDEEIDTLCENMNFDVAIEGYITFTTIEEGYSILMNEYAESEVVGGEMIDHMITNRVFNPSIPEHVLDGAIKMFREWDSEDGGMA